MTHCDSNCVLADTASWQEDRQTARSEAIRGRARQWQLLFLHHTFQWKKGAGLPACCLNLRQTSSSCLGHGTSQSHCHCAPQWCNATLKDFSIFHKICLLRWANKHLETKFPLDSIVINCYECVKCLVTETEFIRSRLVIVKAPIINNSIYCQQFITNGKPKPLRITFLGTFCCLLVYYCYYSVIFIFGSNLCGVVSVWYWKITVIFSKMSGKLFMS